MDYHAGGRIHRGTEHTLQYTDLHTLTHTQQSIQYPVRKKLNRLFDTLPFGKKITYFHFIPDRSEPIICLMFVELSRKRKNRTKRKTENDRNGLEFFLYVHFQTISKSWMIFSNSSWNILYLQLNTFLWEVPVHKCLGHWLDRTVMSTGFISWVLVRAWPILYFDQVFSPACLDTFACFVSTSY